MLGPFVIAPTAAADHFLISILPSQEVHLGRASASFSSEFLRAAIARKSEAVGSGFRLV